MQLLRRAIVLGLSALAALLLVEVGMRVFILPYYWRPLPPFGALTNESQRTWLERQKQELAGAPPTEIGAFDPVLGWAPRPGAQQGGGSTTIHARGWRGRRDYPLPVAPGVTRLAAFGDSYTFCTEVPDDAAWEGQLEALDPGLEVVNMGMGGYGTDQALLRAERELPGLGAELVLVGLLPENIGRNVTRYRPRWSPESYSPLVKPRFVLENGELVLVPLPFSDRASMVRAIESGDVLELLAEHEHWNDEPVSPLLAWSALARLFGARIAYHRRVVDPLWLERGEPFHLMLAILDRFREVARASGGRDAAVLIFPAKPDIELLLRGEPGYWTTLFPELERRGTPYLDLCAPLLEAARASSIEEIYGFTHLSRLGNAVVAQAILAWLRERG